MAKLGATHRTQTISTTPSSISETYKPKNPHEKLYTDFQIYWPFSIPLTSEAAAIRIIRNLENLGLYYTLFIKVTLACAVPLVLVHAVLWVNHYVFEVEDACCCCNDKELAPIVGHCEFGVDGLENV
ncbi:hypothetical protein P8452_65401 [Trifolium repens]|nr:hypothetical protein P8452_65401 [Trifolium repens]